MRIRARLFYIFVFQEVATLVISEPKSATVNPLAFRSKKKKKKKWI